MSKRWHLANRTKQPGQTDRTKVFLPRSGELSACSVTPPINTDQKVAIDAASSLCNEQARSLEIWWDGPKNMLQVVLVTEVQDMDRFRSGITSMYPGAAFSNLERTLPEWYDPARYTYRIFDVGTRHGHYTTAYDTAKPHRLLSQMAGAIQSYRYAWVQVVFARCDLTPSLNAHVQRLNARRKKILGGNYASTEEVLIRSDPKPHDHPELRYDFMNNCARLQGDATLKMQGGQVILSARGLVQADSEVTLPVDITGTSLAGGTGPAYEHLITYQYGYDRFYSDGRKSKIKILGKKHAPQRIEMFDSRLLPAPKRLLSKARSLYFDKSWLGRYRQRPPLPFVILTPSEMPLFVHLPGPSTPNMGITRGGSPPRPSGKVGASLGFFESGGS